MAGARDNKAIGGLGIPNPALSYASLVPVPAGVPGLFESSFTEAGPSPGTARSVSALARLQPFIAAAQESDVLVEVLQAGGARREGCMVGYRTQTEADSEIRGWIPPTEIRGWTSAAYGTAATFDLFQCAVIPSSQEVICVAKRLADGVALSRLWSPTTKQWGAAVDIQAGSGIAAGNHAAVVVLPESELILAMVGTQGTLFSSADKGATWQLYSLQPLGVTLTLPAALKRDRMAVTPNGEIVLFHATATPSEVAQFASSDEGATWEEVETTTALGTGIDVAALPDSSIGVAYGGSFARLASPFDLASAAPTVSITSGAERALWSDFDGVLYVVGREVAAARNLVIQRSKDSGSTWENFTFKPWAQPDAPAATSVGPENLHVVPTSGGALLCHNWAGTGGTFDGSIGAMEIGGWSNVQGGVASGGDLVIGRAAWGGDGAGSGGAWVPIDLPVNMGWLTVGTPPALVAASVGELEQVTAAATGYDRTVLGTEANIVTVGEIRVRAGGNLAVTQIGYRVGLSDGATSSEVEINCDGTGFRVRDSIAATDLATVAIDLTSNDDETDYIQVRLAISGRTSLRVWYKRPSATNWIAVTLTTSTLDFTGLLLVGSIDWRHRTASTSTSRWRQFHFLTGAVALQRISGVNIQIGKGMGGAAYPIPDIGSASEWAYLGLQAGPGIVGQQYEIATFYQFGIQNLFPAIEPSPDTGWRALDETEQILVWDLGLDTLLGKSLFTALLRVEQRTCEVSYAADGAGAWTVLDTFDSGAEFTGLDWVRSGDSVRPKTTFGSPNADRYLFQGEAVGGHFVFSAGKVRPIRECRAGGWGASSTVIPELKCDDVDGTEAATGSGTIVMPDGILVSHTAGIRARFVRLRFPAQDTARGYIGAGTAIPMGYVQALGQLHGWDWGSETNLNSDEQSSAYGTTRFVQRGPPATDWSQNHAGGLDQTDLRQLAPPDLDYQAPTADLAGLAALNDVWLLLRGLIEDLKSGEIPCLSLPIIPDASGDTLTDRSIWTYGRITGGVRADGVVGEEGVDELVRVLDPTVSEIR